MSQCFYRRTLVKASHCMVGVGSTSVGASVGVSAGGIGVFVGNGMGVSVGGTLVGRSVGVRVGIGVLVDIGVLVLVGMSVFVGMDPALLDPLTEGFVPQSTGVFRHLVTSVCKAAGSHALKKS
jgi:hypothetical protein